MADSRIRHVTVPGMRLHLRRGDPNLLWVNGQNLLLVNETAADFIEAFVEVMSGYKAELDAGGFKQGIVSRMQRKYPLAPAAVLISDFDSIYGSLLRVADGSCPVSEVNLGTKETVPRGWTAPPRLDLALTYRCNNNCYFCYTGGPRKGAELKTRDWKKALDKIWDSGVPQVVFTGGEPTLRDDLVELVDHARQFVTGLVTNGRRLKKLAPDLKRVSLDYVQVSLEAADAAIHDAMVGVPGAWQETRAGIEAALKSGLDVVTNTTLTKDNAAAFGELIRSGAALGLKTMACNTLICSGRGTAARHDLRQLSMTDLKATLAGALETAEKVGVRLEWYSPTCYRQFNPVEYGFGAKACSAAQYNMTVEPDGSVIPCQSWLNEKVGNILKDPWQSIWNHPVCLGFRDKAYLKDREECAGCEHLPQCCGGCPLEYSS
jgi:radical SAM protein with 4Fe4S-binding SPASM domain